MKKKDLVQCSSEIFVDDRLPSYFLVVYTYNKVSFPGKYGFPEKSVLVWILYTDVIYTIICTISGSLPWTARALQVTKVFVSSCFPGSCALSSCFDESYPSVCVSL